MWVVWKVGCWTGAGLVVVAVVRSVRAMVGVATRVFQRVLAFVLYVSLPITLFDHFSTPLFVNAIRDHKAPLTTAAITIRHCN